MPIMNPDDTKADFQWVAKALTVIPDRSALVGTCYFEFAFSDSESKPGCWEDGSLYLSDDGFDLIYVAFRRADPGFEYYDFNRFDLPKIDKLLDELRSWESEVSAAQDCRILAETFAVNYRVENYWGRFPWSDLQGRIVQATREVREFIERGRESRQFLWVLGM